MAMLAWLVFGLATHLLLAQVNGFLQEQVRLTAYDEAEGAGGKHFSDGARDMEEERSARVRRNSVVREHSHNFCAEIET